MPPVSKKLRRAYGEQEAEKKIASVLSNNGALVLAWCQECMDKGGHDLDREFTLEGLPQDVRPGLLRGLAMRFIESREGL
jgi:hypothetical protein